MKVQPSSQYSASQSESDRSLSYTIFGVCVAFLLLLPGFGLAAPTVAFNSKGNPIEMLVTVDGCAVYADAAGRTRMRTLRDDELFKDFLVGDGGYVGSDEGATGQFIQALDAISGAEVGYFSGDDVIIDRKEALYSRREDNTRSNIHLKALVVTDYESLSDLQKRLTGESGRVVEMADGRKLVKASALRRPAGDARDPSDVSVEINYYEPFNVWQIRNIGGEDWYLLASDFEVTKAEDFRRSAVGWLPESQLYKWSTRQAVEYDWETSRSRMAAAASGPAGAIIYKKRTVAERAIDLGQAPPETDMWMAKEDLYDSVPWPPEMARYPLIENEELPGAQGGLYRLGFIGAVYGSTGRSGSRRDFDVNMSRRNDIARDQLQLDLLIVIDATLSMEKFKESAIEAVRNIVATVKAEDPPQSEIKHAPEELVTRCSICLYRNYTDDKAGRLKRFDRLPFQVLGDDGNRKIEEFIQDIEWDSSEKSIREEAVFYGIRQAVIDSTQEQKDNPHAYKMMIVVGDSGDLSGNLKIEDVALVLNEQDYDFHAVSVAELDFLDQRPDYMAFRSEMVELASLLDRPAAVDGASFDPASRLYATDRSDYTSLVKQAYKRGLEARGEFAAAIINPQAYPTELQGYVKEFLEKNGVDMNLLESAQVQLFGEGYTTENDRNGISQWREEVLTRRDHLRDYSSKLQAFTSYGGSGIAAKLRAKKLDQQEIDSAISTIESTFDLKAGQFKQGNTSVASLLGNATADLPVRSWLLQMTHSELTSFLQREDEQSYNERSRELARLAICYEVLDAYHYEHPFEAIDEDGDGIIEKIEKKTSDEKIKRWIRRGLHEYAWIPEDYFP